MANVMRNGETEPTIRKLVADCVTYFQEDDMLEVRFAELNSVVDYFIVVEADRTHKGDRKPFRFNPNHPRYADYRSKIVYHQCALPDGEGLAGIWRREIAQRNAILNALDDTMLTDTDIVLISDCDEIPRALAVPLELDDGVILVYQQRLFYYNVNCYGGDGWLGTRATTLGVLRALSADGVRYANQVRGGFPYLYALQQAGWHFSYFGGAEQVKVKLNSFLHQELVNGAVTDAINIERALTNGEDVYGRAEMKFQLVHNTDLPHVLVSQRERFAHFYHENYQHGN